WADDKKIEEFSVESSPDGTRLIIPLESSPSKITIMGSHVIPEFEIAIMIMLISIFGIILLSKNHSLLKPFNGLTP
ncbi:MAG: PEFG-CTERM sorting domain-containing protein, partial [Nitrosopumilaceae archaeon]|nr:PEFG-CTERM sorting domain-containing protein [Nitrosopumilaceae archaeon]NIU00229.1 PEFG-CTERM sorting domain-containing protein [Nitrosopumilaceae archaeon]NIU86641.1 PEFG-CTERM sorting domain-containing protein [Nitrosopumilaceae archaeon]NIV65336.1 PEFG-CTERM sorting domain-containing protein [Nitrosopumilaceae archaeon]NIX60831.1 PEFG-CTERM sorting domain-containing protein [Nitrosopumilaceae archaeon]